MKSLVLILKEKWYHMIRLGMKTEEYREITPYWLKRLFLYNTGSSSHPLVPIKDDFWRDFLPTDEQMRIEALMHLINKGVLVSKHDKVTFYHGYAKDRPSFTASIVNICIHCFGRPEWGSVPGKFYFVIHVEK